MEDLADLMRVSTIIATHERDQDKHRRASRQAYDDALREVVPEHEHARLLDYEAAMTRWAVTAEDPGLEAGVRFGGLVVESEGAQRLAFPVLAVASMSGLPEKESARALEAVASRLASAQ